MYFIRCQLFVTVSPAIFLINLLHFASLCVPVALALSFLINILFLSSYLVAQHTSVFIIGRRNMWVRVGCRRLRARIVIYFACAARAIFSDFAKSDQKNASSSSSSSSSSSVVVVVVVVNSEFIRFALSSVCAARFDVCARKPPAKSN